MSSEKMFKVDFLSKLSLFYQSRGVRARFDLFDKWILFVMLALLLIGTISIATVYLKAHRNYQYMRIGNIIDQKHEDAHLMNVFVHIAKSLESPQNLFKRARDLDLHPATYDQIIIHPKKHDGRMALTGQNKGI